MCENSSINFYYFQVLNGFEIKTTLVDDIMDFEEEEDSFDDIGVCTFDAASPRSSDNER